MQPYSETFRVRSYECDLFQHVNNAVYLHYLQEARLSAHREFGRVDDDLWDLRAEIEYLTPLRYPEQAVITAVETCSVPMRTRWEFEIHHLSSGEKSIQAAIESVPLMNGLPIDTPVNVTPGGTSEGLSYASPKKPAEGSFTLSRQVMWSDLNARQLLDMPALLGYIEECGREVIAAHQWPMERMMASGFAILLRKNQVVYHTPLKLGDNLRLTTWATDVKRASALRHYLVQRAGEEAPAAEVHSLGVWVDLESGRPIRIPPELLEDFRANISE